jgi:hypothetical protein
MKKSFLYVLSAALLLTLSLSGCPQDADDDDDGASTSKPADPVNPPTSDLSYIAYAFGHDINTVKAVNDISLGDNELVIPAGKTLDLASGNVSLVGLNRNSKIIAWGNGKIEFTQAQKESPVLLPKGALIIADEEFINANVYVDYTKDIDGNTWTLAEWENAGILGTDRPEGAPEDAASFRACWDQIVIIKPFEEFKEYATDLPGYRFQEKYVAVKAPASGAITGNDVNIINQKAQNLCFYLAGEPVKFNFPAYTIDFSDTTRDSYEYYKDWKPLRTPVTPVTPVTPGSVFNYINDEGETDNRRSLVVAGDIDFTSGKVRAPGGLTVWGVLKSSFGEDTSDENITGGETPLTTWTVRLNGAAFNSDVTILGSVANTFGGSATFSGKTRITGASIFKGATFNKLAVFGGPVTFDGDKGGDSTEATVIFNDDVLFSDNAYIYQRAKFTATKNNRFYKLLSGLTFDEIAVANLKPGDDEATIAVDSKTISPTDGGSINANILFLEDVKVDGKTPNRYHFPKSVTFAKKLELEGGSLSVIGDAEFIGPVTGGGSISALSAGSTAVFKDDVSIAYGTFATTTTFEKDVTIARVISKGTTSVAGKAEIENGVFLAPITIEGDADIAYGSFGATTVINGKATIPAGTFSGATTINGGADITFGSFSGGPTEISGETNIGIGSFSTVFNAKGETTFAGTAYFANAVNAEAKVSFETDAYFGGTVNLAATEFAGTVSFVKTNSPITINGDVLFGSYAPLQTDKVEITGKATFKQGGSANGGNINTADFDASSQFITSGDLKLSSGGITLKGNGTIAVPIGGLVSLDASGIKITEEGSIGPSIVFKDSGLTLAKGAKLTLKDSSTYFDFIGGGAEGEGFSVSGVSTLTPGSFSATGPIAAVINPRGNLNFPIDTYGGSFTLDHTTLNLTAGGSLTFGGTQNLLYIVNGGNLITDNNAGIYGKALQNPLKEKGIIITTAGSNGVDAGQTSAVLVGGTFDTASINAGSVGTLQTNIITKASRFNGAITGTTAAGGSQAANSSDTDVTVGSIAVLWKD